VRRAILQEVKDKLGFSDENTGLAKIQTKFEVKNSNIKNFKNVIYRITIWRLLKKRLEEEMKNGKFKFFKKNLTNRMKILKNLFLDNSSNSKEFQSF